MAVPELVLNSSKKIPVIGFGTGGHAKSIGVSNFSSKKLQKLLENATIPPAVNQVELNVGWQQEKLSKFCNEKWIAVYAWSPLGANGSIWGSPAVAKVALRWIYEQGAGMIVRSSNKKRMKWNLEIFDWKLTPEEVVKIKEEIPQRRACPGQVFLAPVETLDQLWDSEQ